MKSHISVLNSFFIIILLISCTPSAKNNFVPKIIYSSDQLIITQLSAHAYQHTSFLKTQDFGNVDCNGMLIVDNDEVIVFDTPTDEQSSQKLLDWIKTNLNAEVKAVVATHFHSDCVGGLPVFHNANIPTYASYKTINFAKSKNLNIPQIGFSENLTLKVGNQNVQALYFGEGHTKDNTVGYFPHENVLFGGCLIKEIGATKGNIEDANTESWSATVEKIKQKFPEVKIIIPGHGKFGGTELLDYTITLFSK